MKYCRCVDESNLLTLTVQECKTAVPPLALDPVTPPFVQYVLRRPPQARVPPVHLICG